MKVAMTRADHSLASAILADSFNKDLTPSTDEMKDSINQFKELVNRSSITHKERVNSIVTRLTILTHHSITELQDDIIEMWYHLMQLALLDLISKDQEHLLSNIDDSLRDLMLFAN
ncbi:hypothetical protein GR11A_00087 [Vibrio phage vB_VcorM_GR11A]|nr:hypothetical protein GR11A_00087 [Vibrio phage vB_VcorM_GR11A]